MKKYKYAPSLFDIKRASRAARTSPIRALAVAQESIAVKNISPFFAMFRFLIETK